MILFSNIFWPNRIGILKWGPVPEGQSKVDDGQIVPEGGLLYHTITSCPLRVWKASGIFPLPKISGVLCPEILGHLSRRFRRSGFRAGSGRRVGLCREWVGRVGRAYMMKQAGLYMDKMGNMGRDDRRVNRNGTVVNKNTGKW